MKTIYLLFAILFVFATFQSASAQSDKTQRTIGIKTETIKVSGTCNMDKRRIETAAYSIGGIKSAVWDEYTQVLTLTYSVFNRCSSTFIGALNSFTASRVRRSSRGETEILHRKFARDRQALLVRCANFEQNRSDNI